MNTTQERQRTAAQACAVGWRQLLGKLAAGGAAVLVAAACASESPQAEPPAAQAEPPAAQDQPADQPADSAQDSDSDESVDIVVTIGSTGLGDVVADTAGLTLYVFDPDQQGDSTCYDACAASWPPLLIDGSAAGGEGVDNSLLGSTTRNDGTTQATYDGWPLYYWAGDSAPGDTNGQGVQDVWWVITHDGTVVRGEQSSEPEPAPSADYGY